jgi:glycosyltransferase involved in cell wall biosynthesis
LNRKMRVLYLQHAGSLGGSSMSLLYTIEGIRELGHTCVVALARPSAALEKFYTEAGFETIRWPKLALWDHSAGAPRPLWDPRTWLMYADVTLGWRRAAMRTVELLKETKPDIVHLNSMTFVAAANALIQASIPFVWHIREPPPDQGLRTRVIRNVMRRAPQLIFISDFDRQQWVGRAKGEVIYNFVDLGHFRPDLDGRPLRNAYGIPLDAKVVLYLGGVSYIKGFFVLLDALRILKDKGNPFFCLMPGTSLAPSQSWQGRIASRILPLIGAGTEKQKARKLFAKYDIETFLRPLPFQNDIAPFFAASDLVVFPSTKPHFARPVIESIAMHKPAVGSAIGGVIELLSLHPLGQSTPAGDPVALAAAIREVTNGRGHQADLEDKFKRAKMSFDLRSGVKSILACYDRVLK